MGKEQELTQSIVRNLLNLVRYSHRFGHRLSKEYGISGRRLSVLRYLSETGEHSVSEISRYLNLRDGTTSPLLESMEREGLVSRRRCQTDNRKVLILPTEEGRKLVTTAPLGVFARLRQELPELSIDELTNMDEAISRIIDIACLEESLLE